MHRKWQISVCKWAGTGVAVKALEDAQLVKGGWAELQCALGLAGKVAWGACHAIVLCHTQAGGGLLA